MRSRTAILSTIALTVTLLLAACGGTSLIADDEGPQAIEVGNKAYSAEMYEPALNAYAIAMESMPERSEPTYNTANTLYRQQRFREAVDLYDEILASSDIALFDWTTFNVGNALYEAGDPEQAIEMYKEALRNNPDDMEAKHNLELALAHLPQPPQPPQAPESSQEQPTPEPAPQQQQQEPDNQEQPTEDQQQSEGEPQESEGETEGEPQEGESESEPSEPGDESTEPGTGDQPLEEIVPPTGLTEEQARRLLEMVGENAEPLRNAIQIRRSLPGTPPAQEW